jgi:general secretion pathway protein K
MAMVNTAKALAKQQAKQQGVALITALLIFSLVAIAAVAMADRQSLDIRRTENLIHYDQAYMYALGAELFAAEVLAHGDQDKNIDTLNPDIDPWNTELPPVPVDGGTIGGFIRDATARFPINNMVDANGDRQPVYVNAFQRFVDYMTSETPAASKAASIPICLKW